MAVRHQLPLTVVIGLDGHMTQDAGKEFAGLDRMKARQAAVEKLTEQGLLLKTEDYVHNVGYSQRSHVPIEPYLSEQWFLKYPSVEKSRACVEQEERGRLACSSAPSPTAQPCKIRMNCNRTRARALKCASIRSAGRRSMTTGWATSRTGASAASFGGDTASRCW